MQLVSRILAVLIASVYLWAGATVQGWTPELGTLAAILLLPLTLIWFPDALGDYAGSYRAQMTAPSPAIFVSLAGWFFLVGMPAICFLLARVGA